MPFNSESATDAANSYSGHSPRGEPHFRELEPDGGLDAVRKLASARRLSKAA
jgi:hypothetical protein